MRFKTYLHSGIFLLIVVIFNSTLRGQDLKVENVEFEDMGETVVVKYDLEGKVDKKYKVALSLSDDFGESFNIQPRNMKGDVGKNIRPGPGKEITWYIKKDFPNGMRGEGFVFAVDAELLRGRSKLPYYIAGAVGVVGGVIYFVTRGGGTKEAKPTTGSIIITVPGNI